MLAKNDGVLPLNPGARVAVVGAACAAAHNATKLLQQWNLGDYYVVGGSGRVLSTHAVTVLEGLVDAGFGVVDAAADDLDAALAAAADADVVVMCGGATTTEAAARATLALDNHQFLEAFARRSPAPVVLVALAPGPVLLPDDDAAASLILFLSGEATGSAAAAVLKGAEPGGRLPVTIPRRDGAGRRSGCAARCDRLRAPAG